MSGGTAQAQAQAADTIAAQATARGGGAIAVIRLSGPLTHRLLADLFVPGAASFRDFVPWKLHHGRLVDGGRPLDDALCVYMPGPRTYTGEDCAELHCHGSQAVVSSVLAALFARGAVPARRGEFSRRALINGRMDLSQAEAVAELASAPCREAAEQSLRRLGGELSRRVNALRESLERVRVSMSLAVDFPDDEVEILDRDDFLAQVDETRGALESLLAGADRARLTRDGARVVLAGAVNAGKSSLMNALLGRSRALVTAVPGTTRDFIEEPCLFEYLPVRLVDTAGPRESGDAVESLGMERSREQMDRAECLLAVVDGSAPGMDGPSCPDPVTARLLSHGGTRPVLVVWNKTDLAAPPDGGPAWLARPDGSRAPFAAVSALTGAGVDALCRRARDLILGGLPPDGEDVAPNDRQAAALRAAAEELSGLARDIAAGQMYDLLSVRLDMACVHLDDAIGVGTTEDVLNRVFASFCIGK